MKVTITAEMGYAYITAYATGSTPTFENNNIIIGRGNGPCNILFDSDPGTISLMINFTSAADLIARLEFTWGDTTQPIVAIEDDMEEHLVFSVAYGYDQSTETTTIALSN